jgi:hypothetical protein
MLACALSAQRAGCDNASDIGLGAMLGRCAYNSQHYVSLVGGSIERPLSGSVPVFLCVG